MAIMKFGAKFNAHGFVPGVDISERDWQIVIGEFVAMQKQFVDMSNVVIDRLNEVWRQYERMKKMSSMLGNDTAVQLTRKNMGIEENATYYDWLTKWYKDICEQVDSCAEMAGFKVRSNLFVDNDLPQYGVKFKDKPEWTIDLSLVPVE